MRAVITVTGKDTTGIIAKVCTLLADNDINILDISQTVMHEYFTMSMLVDLAKSKSDVVSIGEKLNELGKANGFVIHTQREEIFDLMYRV